MHIQTSTHSTYYANLIIYKVVGYNTTAHLDFFLAYIILALIHITIYKTDQSFKDHSVLLPGLL